MGVLIDRVLVEAERSSIFESSRRTSAFLTKQMELGQLVRTHRTLREFWLNLAVLPE